MKIKWLRRNRRLNQNNRGQIAIEMILIVVIVVGVSLSVATAFKKNEFLANLVSGPWQTLSGLIQNGVWGTPKDTMAKHPNTALRLNTPMGDEVQ